VVRRWDSLRASGWTVDRCAIAVELRRADLLERLLRGPRDVGNGFYRHAIVVCLNGRTKNRQLLMRPSIFGSPCWPHHAGRNPSQDHTGTSPAFDVARDAANSAHYVLGDVGTGERRARLRVWSRPSRMLAATPGHCWSSRRARLRINFSAGHQRTRQRAPARSPTPPLLRT